MDTIGPKKIWFWIWLQLILIGVATALIAGFYGYRHSSAPLHAFGYPVNYNDLSRILLGITFLLFVFARNLHGKRATLNWFFPLMGIFWLCLAGSSILERTKTDQEFVVAHAATPIMRAAFTGDISGMDSLLHSGVYVNEKNQMGFTALDYASRAIPPYFDKAEGNPKAVFFLLEHGADVEAAGDGGITPLMSAAANGNLELLGMLLDHSAAINKVSPYGWTALAEAVLFQQEEATSFLLQRGADPNVKIESGHHNLLKIAKGKGDKKIIELLDRAGAKED